MPEAWSDIRTESCRLSREGRLLTVELDRPHAMNALHPPASHELARVFDAFESDPELWVAIVTGAGDRAFCAGVDLKAQAQAGGLVEAPPSGFGGLTERHDSTKPVIAAVNGAALGGGFEIALACDLVVASESATFALPEPRVGLAALGGGLHRLPREIGMKRAMGILLTGRHVSAREGAELGFVNEVVPGDELMPVARAWAERILECAPLSVRATKVSSRDGLKLGSVAAAMQASYPALERMIASEDFAEGPRAFAEKRSPVWRAR